MIYPQFAHDISKLILEAQNHTPLYLHCFIIYAFDIELLDFLLLVDGTTVRYFLE